MSHLRAATERGALRRRRGLARQRVRRVGERRGRESAVAFGAWLQRQGLGRSEAARCLGIPARTLRRWRRGWERNRLRLVARGRPPRRVARAGRRQILATIETLGAKTGLPRLQGLFPAVARGEIQDLQRRVRQVVAWRRRRAMEHLCWTQAGICWAMDFAQPPAPIDGTHRRLFTARDLGSHAQLVASPTEGERAVDAEQVLETLVQVHGAPLVLKCDNGSAFIAARLLAWADQRAVRLLYSPPRTPSYNGSIEASIGALKERTEAIASRERRAGEWTGRDLEEAVRQGNETCRPWGSHGPTPEQAWQVRRPIMRDERATFEASYRRHYALECARRELPWGAMLPRWQRASIDRAALPAALIDCGYLEVRRRRITPSILLSTADKIS